MRTDVEEIFHAARQKAGPGERAAFLDGACRGDPALRAKVDALLKADAEAGSFLESIQPGPPAGDGPPSERPGQSIGRYRLLQLLGEGGFGSVWMAEQRDPVKRRVALKVIKLGMDTKQVIARFELERQALALMDHPNIAKVLDGGCTETGRPFFVMELVRGVPILQYCDTERADTRTRLRLFVSVCQAIQHAHQKGIIHRDIKPSNVLVTMHDGVPVPKVIDFGVAKATHAELTERTLFTEHRQMIGTPAYMSPEQAEMSGLDVDTRSDIYSLGVLLYELLTGTTPFDVRDLLSKGFDELMRVIREVEPHKPSTRISTLGDSATRAAQQRHVADPRKLGLLLRGDLDWIVMKCLEKDRTRRYETANGLAADVLRHLNDEPVIASPPGAAYRLAKFVRRNRRQVLAAGCVAVALALGVIGTTWGMLRALEQKRRAQLAGEETVRELARATEVKRLITQMLYSVSPEKARGADVTLLREILDDTAARLERGEVQDERIAAELFDLVAMVEGRLGLTAACGEHVRRGLEIRRRLLGEEHPETLESMGNLGVYLTDAGRLADAEELLARTLEIERRRSGDESLRTLRLTEELARAIELLGRHGEAKALYERLVEVRTRLQGSAHDETLATRCALAHLLRKEGRLAEAEPIYLELVEIDRRRLGADHPCTMASVEHLAMLRADQGRHDEATSLELEVLADRRRVMGEGHPATLIAMNNLATILGRGGRHEEAVELWREEIEIVRREHGQEHPRMPEALLNLALTLRFLGRDAEAEPLTVKAVDLHRRRLGAEHPDTLTAVSNLALLYRDQGRTAESEKLQLETLRIRERVLGEEHTQTLISRVNLADLYRILGRDAESAPLYESALAGLRRHFGTSHVRTVPTMRSLARTYAILGRTAEALALERELLDLAIAAAEQPEADSNALNETAWRLLTHSSEPLRDRARALAFAERACAQAEGAGSDSLWACLDTLALAQHETGDSATALETQRRAVSLVPADAAAATVAELETRLRTYEAAVTGADGAATASQSRRP